MAIKTTLADNEDGLAELCQEAAIMVQVESHPNVVALIGIVLEVTSPISFLVPAGFTLHCRPPPRRRN